MTAAETVGWVGVALVLSGYVTSVKTNRPNVFHWANAIGAFGTGASAVETRNWPSFVITACFGAIGWYALIHDWRSR